MSTHTPDGGSPLIVRENGRTQLLITQPDHAALAAHIMEHWQAGALASSPRRAAIMLAIREHDNGWREVDAGPTVGDRGRLLDYVTAPDDIRRGVWPRAVARLAHEPWAAALVAQHALHIYRRFRSEESWGAFFSTMEALRERHLEEAGAREATLIGDYPLLRVADLLSLTFCNGWTEPQADDTGLSISAHLEGTTLVVSPDPFAGARVRLEIEARELPNGQFGSTERAVAAFRSAGKVRITGEAVGR